MMNRARLHAAAGLTSLAAFLAAALLPGGAPVAAAGEPCGRTTLDATIVLGDDGRLRCGPGEELTVREDLAEAASDRAQKRSPLGVFFGLADIQLVDEESPLRAEWLDKCPSGPAAGTFRPHETLLPHLLNAHVRAANRLASSGSPVLGAPYDFAVQLGDAADNQHRNELRAVIDLLDGGTIIDPDSGADGYEGVQGSDPSGRTPVARPTSDRLLDLANEPFHARGLRTDTGIPIPWYTVVGSHDIKVQGTVPDDQVAWRSFARAWAAGSLKLQDLAPDHQKRACSDPSVIADPGFWQVVAASPGAARLVSPDPEGRALLDRAAWMREHFTTTGAPAGHGLAEENRCRDAQGAVLARACYAWHADRVHYIVLDTSSAEGVDTGNVDADQFAWLTEQLIANSSSYFDGDEVVETGNPDRLIVVFSHHTVTSTSNPMGEDVRTGEELTTQLLRFPNVILHANGHTHENRIWAHRSTRPDGTVRSAYWEINTAAVADWPSQSRSIEIADNHDGTLSIFGIAVDAAVAPDPRAIAWSDDATPESTPAFGGASRDINEDWLAALALEVAANDPDAIAGRAGRPEDRNVELLLQHPLGVTDPLLPPPPLPPVGVPPTFPGFPGVIPGFPSDFPTGFPGGIPDNFGQPPVPDFQPPTPRTEIGLGAPQAASTPWGARAALLFTGAALGAFWLVQARVRRWMIGI